MELYWYWPGEEFDVPLEATPKIEDRRLIDYEPPVQQPEVEKRATVPYSFIRDKLVPVHIDRPWGTPQTISNAAIMLDPDEEVTIGKVTGFGWIMFSILELDSSDFLVTVYRDGEPIYPAIDPTTLYKELKLKQPNHVPRVTRYDTYNDKYTIAYDPMTPLHFENSFWINVKNNEDVQLFITRFRQSVIVNED